MKIKLLLGIFALTCLASMSFYHPENKEEAGVKEAVLNYVEGLYEVDSNRIKQSVHPDLYKIGYFYRKDKQAYSGPLRMTFQQLVDLAASWNKDGNSANEDSPKEIEVLDVLDKTATAKLTAAWGVDYFQLAKEGDQWMIMNVLWQSPPM